MVTACPVHGQLLVDACDECGDAFWHHRKTKPWACGCGREMTKIQTSDAPKGAIAVSRAIMSYPAFRGTACHIEADRSSLLPPELENLPLDDLLAVVTKIGVLAATPASEDFAVGPLARVHRGVLLPANLEICKTVHIVEAAYAVLSDWPKSADPLFAAIACRNRDPAADHPVLGMFATEMGYRLLSRLKSRDGRLISVIDQALESWLLREHGIYIDGRRRAKIETGGLLAIDVADAMRRLEGSAKVPLRIFGWVDAGVVTMVGKKVSMMSVERALKLLEVIPKYELEDGIDFEAWNTGQYYCPHYRRSDIIHDIFSGAIRTSPACHQNRTGLAALLVSLSDLRRGAKVRTPKNISAYKPDTFTQPSKIYTIISKLWPGEPTVDFISLPNVRNKVVVRQYRGRDYRRRLYSLVDVIDVMSEIHGPP